MQKDKPEKNLTGEPSVTYKRLKISTMEEQEQNNYYYWSSLTPLERVKKTVELIKVVFADRMNLPRKYDRIHIGRS
jgi:hypothetical protein